MIWSALVLYYILYPKKNKTNRGPAPLGRGLLWTWLLVLIGTPIKYS
jgi:hypothetical protein